MLQDIIAVAVIRPSIPMDYEQGGEYHAWTSKEQMLIISHSSYKPRAQNLKAIGAVGLILKPD